MWLDYNYKAYLKADLSLGGDAGFRTDVGDRNWNALYIRPRVTYRFNQTFEGEVGIGLFQNWNAPAVNDTELRFEQQLNAKWPQFKYFRFENRLRADERFIHYQKPNSDQADLADKWDYRVRYRIMVKSEYFNVSEKITNVYALIYSEFFFPIGDDGLERYANRNRTGIGFGQLLPKGHRYELNFLWQQSAGKTEDSENTDQWILRLRYYFKQNLFN